MKKLLIGTLVLVMLLSLAACGGSSEKEAAPTAAPAVTEAPAATEAPTAEPAEETVSPAGEDDLAETIALVQSLKDHDVSDLYAAIGEPESSDYGSSCLVQGGQDGQLFYDGFTVYTLVQPDGTETVYDVE